MRREISAWKTVKEIITTMTAIGALIISIVALVQSTKKTQKDLEAARPILTVEIDSFHYDYNLKHPLYKIINVGKRGAGQVIVNDDLFRVINNPDDEFHQIQSTLGGLQSVNPIPPEGIVEYTSTGYEDSFLGYYLQTIMIGYTDLQTDIWYSDTFYFHIPSRYRTDSFFLSAKNASYNEKESLLKYLKK